MTSQAASEHQARPIPTPLLPLLLPLAAAGLCEADRRLDQAALGAGLIRLAAAPFRAHYDALLGWVQANPKLATMMVAAAGGLGGLAYRYGLLFWHNQLKARASGTHFQQTTSEFPARHFELLEQIGRRPRGHSFLGMQASRGLLGWSFKPFYLSQAQRSMHTHVLGKTGSGKTTSVIWPQVLQDALDGKGVLVMDAKGSDENIRTMKGIAALAGRPQELRVFALPAWSQPQLFSHRYNMVQVQPRRAPGEPSGAQYADVSAMAERVFSVLPLGDNEYYNVQAQQIFTNVCRLLHGMVDPSTGRGLPFNMRDIAVCLKGVGACDKYAQALAYCLERSVEREVAGEIQNQVSRLGAEVRQCFSGVIGAVDQFRSPLVNAYAPDLDFERVLQQGQLVYVQLPGNLFKVQAPAVGKAMLMDVQQEGSLRQVFRAARSQRPFSVVVDEFYNFADLSIIDSLNKLRDAHLHFTLAHQSIADLELVSKEFAVAVWDNARTKVILNQDNPELCEKVSKSIGTQQVVEKTVRHQQGALFTSLATGDASTKLVEAFRLHPNAIKSLAPAGQGYCYFGGASIVPLALQPIPRLEADYPLVRNRQAEAPGLRLEERFLNRKQEE